MVAVRARKRRRKRVGRVSYFWHHGAWHLYYREGQRQVRRRVGSDESTAARVAAELNAQISADLPTLFSFAPLNVAELRQRFLDYHEHVIRSSLATVNRYRAATEHLVRFSQLAGNHRLAHQVDAEAFVRYLRGLRISPNGHQHTPVRQLRDKGIRFILETCRSLFGYAVKKRHLPPYAENPFIGLGGKRLAIEDAKRIFVFNEQSELAFFQHADDWAFPLHFLLAKTGLRPGEAVHLLIEDLDLDAGWMLIRNKPELGWKIKTRRERTVPLVEELVLVLRRVIGNRQAGPVFLRPKLVDHRGLLAGSDYHSLVNEAEQRITIAENTSQETLPRQRMARIHRAVWHDAGAVRADRVRTSFVRIACRCGLEQVTCPKSCAPHGGHIAAGCQCGFAGAANHFGARTLHWCGRSIGNHHHLHAYTSGNSVPGNLPRAAPVAEIVGTSTHLAQGARHD